MPVTARYRSFPLFVWTSETNFWNVNTQIATLNKYTKSNQNKFIMKTSALKEPLIYLCSLGCDVIKTPGVSRFVTLTLEILGKRKLCYTPFHQIPPFLLITSGYSTCTYYFLNTPGNSIPSTPCIVFLNSPLHLFKLLLSKFM